MLLFMYLNTSKIGVQPIWKVKSNVSSIGPSLEKNIMEIVVYL